MKWSLKYFNFADNSSYHILIEDVLSEHDHVLFGWFVQ